MKPMLLIAALGLVLAGCTASGDDASTTSQVVPKGPDSTSKQDSQSAAEETRYPIDRGLDPMVSMAADDLSKRERIERDQIRVLNAYLVTFPDSSLGCPEADEAYLPVVTDGSVIELVVDGVVYRYHTGGDLTEPFFCEEPARDESPLDGTPLELEDRKDDYPGETVPPPRFDD